MYKATFLLRGASFCALALFGLAACNEAKAPESARPPLADKWFHRAEDDYAEARVDDAHEALEKALSLVPNDADVRVLGGRIALARLECDESLRLLKSVPGSEAQGLRGRAYWCRGDLSLAADELEAMLNDPEVHDDAAKAIAGLARRGEGRTPFGVSGAMLVPIEMAHVSQIAPYFVIPVEIDGEEGLALVETGISEVVVDSSARAEPSWISLRFGQRLEVSDVPALAQDLTGISKEIGAPIKALLGMNLLRHLNVTIDYYGRQFVARSYAAPPPPNATRLNLYYGRGGGIFVQTSLGAGDSARAALFLDSSARFPISLDEHGWEKAGITAGDLKLVPGDPDQKLREGVVPMLKLGAFDVPRVAGVLGAPVHESEKGSKLALSGTIGSPVLADYRITFSDGGRMMWLEDNTEVEQMMAQPPAGAQGGPGPNGGNPDQPDSTDGVSDMFSAAAMPIDFGAGKILLPPDPRGPNAPDGRGPQH